MVLAAYFGALNLPPPAVVDLGVDGGSSQPTGSLNGPDVEVALDIDVAGSVAPAAKIAVYFPPSTDRGFLDALSSAVHDQTSYPSVVSISWGGSESSWTAAAMDALNGACRDAAAIRVTVCVASRALHSRSRVWNTTRVQISTGRRNRGACRDLKARGDPTDHEEG